MPTTDQARLQSLIRARHPCIRIVTPEESEALGLVRDSAISAGRDLWLWSAVKGLGNGLLADSPTEPGTENAAAALYRLSRAAAPTMAVVLDLAGFLKDERTLRAWRDLVEVFGANGGCLVMIDYSEDVPS